MVVVVREGNVCRGVLQLVNKRPGAAAFDEAEAAMLERHFGQRFIGICAEAAETLMLEKAKSPTISM